MRSLFCRIYQSALWKPNLIKPWTYKLRANQHTVLTLKIASPRESKVQKSLPALPVQQLLRKTSYAAVSLELAATMQVWHLGKTLFKKVGSSILRFSAVGIRQERQTFRSIFDIVFYNSSSQTFSDRVPFVGPVFSPRTILKTPCSRKTQSTQYYSIKSLSNQTWRKWGMNNMAVRNYNGHFSKLIREVHRNAGIY